MGMENDTLLHFRQTIKHLVDMPTEKIDAVAELFAKRTYKKNELFSSVEKPSTYLGYIAKGLVRVFAMDRDGNEAILNFRGEYSFTAAFGGIALNNTQPVNIQALEDSEIYVLERDEFIKIYKTDTDWKDLLNTINEYDSLQLREREISFLQDDAKKRYSDFMKNFCDIADRIKLRYVSSYIGVSAETLSRIRSALDCETTGRVVE